MAESTFNNFFNKGQSFGMNIKVPTKTLEQFGKTVGDTAGGVLEPLFTYLEENENVFSGDVTNELNKKYSEHFNTTLAMTQADIKVNGEKSTFDMKF